MGRSHGSCKQIDMSTGDVPSALSSHTSLPAALRSTRPLSYHDYHIPSLSVEKNRGETLPDNCIMALTEGRGAVTEVGMCVLRFNSNECILSQTSDSQLYTRTMHKIQFNDPQKIVLSSALIDAENGKLYKLLIHALPHVKMVVLPRKFFQDDAGLKYISDYGLRENAASLLLAVSTKRYCLASVAAAFRYDPSSNNEIYLKRTCISYVFEQENITFINHTVKITYESAKDASTAQSLELITSLSNRQKKYTLLGVLDHTSTPMGSRLLRINVLQPLTDIETINARLDTVQELTENEEMLFEIKSSLESFADLDRIVADIIRLPAKTMVHHTETKINQVVMLKTTLSAIQNVQSCLCNAESALLQNLEKVP
ncbi:MutS protein msh4 [Apophysomyces sp. BC1034]|nr:MutS protein msh4 [Apophysomyces sp. BC1034]